MIDVALRTVLIIAYYFPPDGGAGTQRATKFCKYLPEFGWRPMVVTREAGSSDRAWAPHDQSLVRDLGATTEVFRASVAQSSRGPLSRCRPNVDAAQAWCDAAYEQSLELARRISVDCILITMSPFSLVHLGAALARDTGLPVVYDFRDPWTFDGWPTFRHYVQWREQRHLMVRTLRLAAGVIANTPEAERCFAEVMPELRGRLRVVPNGYDEDDFRSVRSIEPPRDRFTLVYTGTLMPSREESYVGMLHRAKGLLKYSPEKIFRAGRSARYLLEAIVRVRRAAPELCDALRVAFVGTPSADLSASIEEVGLQKQVEVVGYAPHDESMRWLMRASALFLPLHGLPPGCRSRIVPGKTYEYLASGRPILGCLPPGDARDLVAQCGHGFLADPCDPEEIGSRLVEMIGLWKADQLPRGPAEWVTRYERRRLTSEVADLLKGVSYDPVATEDLAARRH